MQTLVVAVIVAWCLVWAAWMLMPGSLRSSLAERLLKIHWPAFVERRLKKAARTAGGCGGCSSCGDEKADEAGLKPVRIHRKVR